MSCNHQVMYRVLAGAAVVLVLSAGSALAQPGWVLSHQKIDDTEGGFTGILDDHDFFGRSAASLGDLDGDGVDDLAVGATFDDDGGTPPDAQRGAVWVLFLNTDGTVKAHQKISDTQGGFTGILDDDDQFGSSVASLGDLDGDGVTDLAVGAAEDDDGGTGSGANRGAVWVLFLNTDGTVKSHQKISDTQGGFTGTLDDDGYFGNSVASLGDLDGDRVPDLAVGAFADDDGGSGRGAVWVLFLNPDGTVKAHQKISDTQGGFTGILDNTVLFGSSVASLGDLDGDGVGDLAVGARRDDDGCEVQCDRGAVWVLFLNTDGTVNSHQKISDTQGGFTGVLDDFDWFGSSVGWLGDLDGDAVADLAVAAPLDDDGGFNSGAVWVLFLNTDGTVKAHQKISDTEGGFTGILDNGDSFGDSLASLGDLDGDGVGDLAVGAHGDDDGGFNRGAVWVLFLDGILSSPADITGPLGGVPDGCVDAFDLGAMLGAWCSAVNDPIPPSPPCENCIPANLALADISGSANVPDGCIDAFDLAKLLAEWCSVAGGNPCGTCGP
ncbi:MAG: FG-GAP repeat protein [Planctomycetes bacterium]|nr:FG-GAP repeat protein [Planctomycetota bacterium]